MKNIIDRHILYSKYAEERYISVINNETLIIKAHDIYTTTLGFGNRAGNSYKNIDFTGGPHLKVNATLRLKNKLFKVKSIFEKSAPYEWKCFMIKGEFIK